MAGRLFCINLKAEVPMLPFIAILLALQLQAGQTGVVTGQLLLTNGKPATGVRIAVTPAVNSKEGPAAGDLLSLAETDETGHYRLENILPGQYFIQAGPLDSPNYYPGVRTIDRAMGITVIGGKVLELPEFRLPKPPGAMISGRLPPDLEIFPSDIAVLPASLFPVVDRILSGPNAAGAASRLSIKNGALNIDVPSGSPSGGPAHMVLSLQGRDSPYYPAQINSDGTFVISGLLPGVYSLIAVPSSPLLIRTVVVGEDDIELSAPPETRWKVSGVVGLSEGSRVPGQRLTLSGSMWGQLVTTSNSSGEFEFSNVPPGTFSIKNNDGAELTTVIVRDHDIDRVTVPALFLLNGRVKVPAGMAFPGVRLTATSSDGRKTVSNIFYRGETVGGNEAGFSMPLPEGEYRITAELAVAGVIESLLYGLVDLKTSPMIVRFPTQVLRITIGKQ